MTRYSMLSENKPLAGAVTKYHADIKINDGNSTRKKEQVS